MGRWFSRAAAWMVMSTAALVLAQGADSGKSIEGWGRPEDPLGDCRIHLEGKSLVIEVPGKLHDLVADMGVVNAPMVLDDVERDFIVGVKVAKAGRADGESTSGYSLPYQGAGLLLWKDRDNYIRLERASMLRGREVLTYINFGGIANGNRTGGHAVQCPEGPVALRLEKRKDRVLGSISVDGTSWSYLPPVTATGRGPWKVGVTAVNSASVPLRAELEDFVIFEARPPAKPTAPATPKP
jgi:hypothetical protein